MPSRKNTDKLRKTNDSVKSAAGLIQRNVAHPGRPCKYHPGFSHIAERAATLGATLNQLAEMFGVNDSTVSSWMTSYPTFNSAIKRGRARMMKWKKRYTNAPTAILIQR